MSVFQKATGQPLMKSIVYDIETIPAQNLSKTMQEALEKRLVYALKNKDEEETEQELKSRLMATSPYFGEIVCISTYDTEKELYKSFDTESHGLESNIVSGFNKYLSGFEGRFVGYNSLDFDAHFIILRSMFNRKPIENKTFLELKRFQKYPHFDVMQIMSNWSRSRLSLHAACDFLDIPSPKDNGFEAKDVYAAWKRAEYNKIRTYCVGDVQATYMLYLNVNHYVK
ncbi:MAG: hypothetical protein ACW98F_00185 [Candidatus Hodarchaeales archaeon]|jgi:predicted PolB exonuclease-like 3'-5' exonuclease